MKKNLIINLAILISALSFAATAFAQTSAFTYQGKLNDGGSPVGGVYQFQFKLYDAASGGNQVGQPLTDISATVSGGVFAVSLDFGAAAFDGSDRFLEVGARMYGSSDPYTILNPRYAITSTPYAIRSFKAEQASFANTAATAGNTTNLGGVPAAQYVQANDSRMSDARSPLPGSANYIQNTQNQQSNSNFNISGEGKANKFNAATQYDINGNRVLSVTGGGTSTLVGVNTSASGSLNSFVGFEAGKNNLGSSNSFFGYNAGRSNALGANNAYLGANAGYSGWNNNSTFVGFEAGKTATGGSNNTAVGYQATVANNLINATAIGANAVATQSNSLVLGTSATSVQVPGSFGVAKSMIINQDITVGNTINAPKINIFGNLLKVDPTVTTKIQLNGKTEINDRLVINGNGSNSLDFVVNGHSYMYDLKTGNYHFMHAIGGGASEPGCLKKIGEDWIVSQCSSSIRYKENVQDYRGGLDLVRNLRPVSYNWKENGTSDLGFIAEEVYKLEPRFSVFNKNNEIEGVKYQLITVSLVSAIQEQQEQIKQQQAQIEALKALVCSNNKNAGVCRK